MGTKDQNYSAFKFIWTGIPKEDIALVREKKKDRSMSLYVRQTDQTLTIYPINEMNEKGLIGETARTGFQTAYNVKRAVSGEVVAEAYDASGEFLPASSQVSLVKENEQHKPVD